MPQSVRIGCAGLPHGMQRDRYFASLGFLETDATPRPSVLARWRAEAPPDAAFAVVAPPQMTFAPGDASHAAWQRALDAARALAAEVVIVSTPPAFSPSEPHRADLKRFMAEEAAGAPAVAWEPRGLWERAQAARFAAELGLVFSYDPLAPDTDPVPAPSAYFRIHGLGIQRGKFSDDDLEELAEVVAAHERAWVVFTHPQKFSDAQRFRKLWDGRGGPAV